MIILSIFCRVQGEVEKDEEDIYGGTTDDDQEETAKKGSAFEDAILRKVPFRCKQANWNGYNFGAKRGGEGWEGQSQVSFAARFHGDFLKICCSEIAANLN